jgi:hypothetical protein
VEQIRARTHAAKGDGRVNFFEVLLMGHLVGDFLLQIGWMAREKVRRYDALLVHAGVYTLAVAVAAALFGRTLDPAALALLFVSHAVLDRRTFVRWWARTVGGIARAEDQWLIIVIDQVFHLLVLVLVVWLTAAAR